MQLTVQEIVAKVALQKKQQMKVQQQNILLQQINTLTMPNSKSTQKNSKLPSQAAQNPNPLPTTLQSKSKTKHSSLIYQPLPLQAPNNQIIIQEKYKNLLTVYKKLKRKQQSQIHIKNAYTQIQKKLQEMIKKNSKLQRQLDAIRSKKSYFQQKSQQKNSKLKCMKQSELFTSHTMSIQKIIISQQIKKESKLNFRKQKHQIIKLNTQQPKNNKNHESVIEEQNFKGLQNEHKQIQHVDDDVVSNQSQQKHKMNEQYETSVWFKREIQLYKDLVDEKQQSIMKLTLISQKQNNLLRKYEQISGTIQLKQNNFKQDKIQLKKTQKVLCRKVSKIEGTIVKVRRLKKQTEQLLSKRNTQFTTNTRVTTGVIKSRSSTRHDHIDELSGVATNQNTQIKLVRDQRRKTKQYRYNIKGFQCSGSSYKTAIENQNNWMQQPLMMVMNQTSEFICQV